MSKKFWFMLVVLMLCGQTFAASNWFVNTELKSDFRYRWQQERYEGGETATANGLSAQGDKYTRYRERIRYRLAIENKANDEMFFGARLATGGVDPLSTNQTMGDGATAFAKRGIMLDQAYLKYTPAWITQDYGVFMVEFGKFDVKDAIYTVSDVMWDSDISLEGKNINYNYKGIEGLNLFANLGNYIAQEDAVYDDAILNVQQVGAFWNITNVYTAEAAVGKYVRNRSGSTDTAAYSLYDQNIDQQQIKLNADTMALGLPVVERISILNERYLNHNAEDRNHGEATGFEIGSAKLAKLGDWSFRALNRSVEKNSGWTLGDSDAYGNAINVSKGTATVACGLNARGTEMVLQVGIAENATFSIDQYLMDVYNNDLTNDWGPQKLTQFDVNVKF